MKLPLLLSVPHAGLWVPPEVRDQCVLTTAEVADDGDDGAQEIYDLSGEVEGFVTSEVARAIVDFNRAEDDLRKDGVIKTHTCWDVPVYREELSPELVEMLIARYHRPYHRRLRRPRPKVILGVDCHTMAAKAPPVAPDPGQRRPAVCLSNVDGETCPMEWLGALASCFEEHFDDVRLNTPFRGGYIVRSHSAELPWVQVELSRDPGRALAEKRCAVLESLNLFCEREIPRLLALKSVQAG